mgnify:CR=1 FL=1|tara:strand:- start:19528 stop:19983 length:456 start_codon:yes stop_codon:yes gene_type:complete
MSIKLIAHRSNINGPVPSEENTIHAINKALSLGFDVEIDVRIHNDKLYLGHDSPQDLLEMNDIKNYKDRIWVHCKDINSLALFNKFYNSWNYFFHEDDLATITSKGFLWLHPRARFLKSGILVWPGKINFQTDGYQGICSDYVTDINNYQI